MSVTRYVDHQRLASSHCALNRRGSKRSPLSLIRWYMYASREEVIREERREHVIRGKKWLQERSGYKRREYKKREAVRREEGIKEDKWLQDKWLQAKIEAVIRDEK